MKHLIYSSSSNLQEISADIFESRRPQLEQALVETTNEPKVIFSMNPLFFISDFKKMEKAYGIANLFDGFILMEQGETLKHYVISEVPVSTQNAAEAVDLNGNTLVESAASIFTLQSREYFEITDFFGRTSYFVFVSPSQKFYPEGIAPYPNSKYGQYVSDKILKQADDFLSRLELTPGTEIEFHLPSQLED